MQTSPLTGLSGSLQSQQQQPQVTAQPVYPQGGPVQQPQVFAQPEYPPIKQQQPQVTAQPRYPPIKQQQPQATAQPVFRKPVYPQPSVAQQHHQLTSQDMWSYPPEARFVLSRNCLARTTQQITPADADEYARYIAGDRDAILMRRTGKTLAELVASARS
jgi:hypothetical protein